MRQIKIFDTTLRDGEQAAGVNLNVDEKVLIAKQLERLKIDVIEAGFAVASPGDFACVQAISRELKDVQVASLARAIKGDIDKAWEALHDARNPLIHTFIATSDIHMNYKLRKKPEEVLEMAVSAVSHARKLCPNVEFSAEDATRSDWDFLCKVFAAVIKAGAKIINIPDTVGYTVPTEFVKLINYVKEHTKGIEKVDLAVHCHNDLGLAVANSLAAVECGVAQVECTINGLGDRAGNAALEEIVMALKTRSAYFNTETRVITEQIHRTSSLVSTLTGQSVQRNKPIVGENAFAHEAGIHQDGIIKNPLTYEIMTPESVGLSRSRLSLGKHSGRHAVKARLEELGFALTDEAVDKAYKRFLEIADKKKEVSDFDLEALVRHSDVKADDAFELEYLHVSTGNSTVPTATVRLVGGGKQYQEAACGDGPIDAIYRVLDRISGLKTELIEYNIKAVTSGQDALGEVLVRVKYKDALYVGRGVSTDVIEASARAYLHALNKVRQEIKRAAFLKENSSEF